MKKIAWFGYKGHNSWSQKHVKYARRAGYEVEIYTPNDWINQPEMLHTDKRLKYTLLKYAIPLSTIFKGEYDFAVITQTYLYIENDLDIPVFYFHREWDLPPRIDKCNMVWMQHLQARNELMYVHDKWWGNNHPMPWSYLWCAVDHEEFEPKEKTVKGLTYFSIKEAVEREKRQFCYNWQIKNYWDMTEKCLPYCDNVHEGYDLPFVDYKDCLERAEAMLLVLPPFPSRRTVECAMAKTLIVRWIPDDGYEGFLNQLGWEHGKNCLFFRDEKELKEIHKKYFSVRETMTARSEKQHMVDAAYDNVMLNHTYEKRNQYLMEKLELYYNDFKPSQVHPKPLKPVLNS
jgi:hypothetical protein